MFFFYLFKLCSARVSALVTVLSEHLCKRTGKWDICQILNEGMSLVHILAGASATSGVTRARVSKVM